MSNSRYKKNYDKTKHLFTGWFNQQYKRMSQRNRTKFGKDLPFDRWDFEKWVIDTQYQQFVEQFKKWEESGYLPDERPSTDRVDDSLGYSLDNIQIISWKENKEKEWASARHKNTTRMVRQTKKPIFAIDKNGTRTRYGSLSEASRALGIDTGAICECCKGKRVNRKGWRFIYVQSL